MPFDPALPANNAPNSSAEMRAQLTALHDDIQTRATTADMGSAITGAVADKVSSSQLTTAINTTANNPTSVSPIGGSFADPDINAVKDKLNELITALFRAP